MTKLKSFLSKLSGPVRIGLVLALALAAALAVYLQGLYYFSSHFLPATQINGRDVSKLLPGEAALLFEADLDAYKITITSRGGLTDILTGADVGLTYTDADEFDRMAASQDPRRWPAACLASGPFQTFTLASEIAPDSVALARAVAGLACFAPENDVLPTDAYLDTSAIPYTIVPETEGASPDLVRTFNLVNEAVLKQSASVDLDTGDVYARPAVYADDPALNARMEAYNTFFDHACSLTFGNAEQKITPAMIAEALTENPDGIPVLDETHFAPLVDKCAEVFNTYGRRIILTGHDGNEISTISGDYGLEIDRAATLAALNKAILEGGTPKPVLSHEAPWSNGTVGESFIEISLADQHLWLIIEGEAVLDFDVVTGSPTGGRATMTGVWSVKEVEEEKTVGVLSTQNNGMTVRHWVGFNGRQGIHSAPWRSAFGADVFAGDGSMGCVNAPPEAMAELFAQVETGMPVVIY